MGAEAGSDLAPDPDPADSVLVVAAPARAVATASARTRSALITRAILAVVVALLAAVGSLILVRQGIRTDDFPPFVGGAETTPITRYSGPWLTAAAGAFLVAALLLMSAVIDLMRWLRQAHSAGA